MAITIMLLVAHSCIHDCKTVYGHFAGMNTTAVKHPVCIHRHFSVWGGVICPNVMATLLICCPYAVSSLSVSTAPTLSLPCLYLQLTVQFNVPAALEGFKTLGKGLVKNIENQRESAN